MQKLLCWYSSSFQEYQSFSTWLVPLIGILVPYLTRGDLLPRFSGRKPWVWRLSFLPPASEGQGRYSVPGRPWERPGCLTQSLRLPCKSCCFRGSEVGTMPGGRPVAIRAASRASSFLHVWLIPEPASWIGLRAERSGYSQISYLPSYDRLPEYGCRRLYESGGTITG